MNELQLYGFKAETLADTKVTFALQQGLWLNATEVAKSYGKDLQGYWRLQDTIDYIDVVAESNSVLTTELKIAVKGKYGGTYIHPDLVISFARWVNPKFAYECDKFIKDEIIRVNTIKTEALLEQAEKDKQQAVMEAKRCKIYDDGSMSVRGIIQHLGLDVTEDFVWDALTYAGFNEDITKVTKYRRIPDNTPSYIGTPRGTQSPTFFPQVVKQVVLDYMDVV